MENQKRKTEENDHIQSRKEEVQPASFQIYGFGER